LKLLEEDDDLLSQSANYREMLDEEESRHEDRCDYEASQRDMLAADMYASNGTNPW
jgi:hypothetical protein